MTREEAIRGLKVLRKDFSGYKPNEEMFDMAIEALEQVTGKLNNPDDSLLTADSEACKEKKSKLDLISRAEAIDALRYAQHRFTVADEAGGMGSVKWSENVIYFAAAERVLTELPSTERPKGEWIDEDGTYYANCSKCGYQMDTHQERGYHNFCSNCGADMRPIERSEE